MDVARWRHRANGKEHETICDRPAFSLQNAKRLAIVAVKDEEMVFIHFLFFHLFE